MGKKKAAAPAQPRGKKGAKQKPRAADSEAPPSSAPAPAAAQKRKGEQRGTSDAKKGRKASAASSVPEQDPKAPADEASQPTTDAAVQGGLQVFGRLPEGRLVSASVVPAATVADLIEEVRQAAGLQYPPQLRFLGKTLEGSMAVADTGVTSEAVVEVDPSLTTVSRVAIAAGMYHSLALVDGGTRVQSWGNNAFDQCTIPDFGGLNAIQIAAGYKHSVALLEDLTVRVWGNNDYKQCMIPSFGGLKVVQIVAGGFHSMALMEDHTVRAWGSNKEEQRTIPDFGAQKVLQIAAGGNASYALLEDHTVRTWGDKHNRWGFSRSPEFDGLKVLQIAAGRDYGIALMEDHTVREWGKGARLTIASGYGYESAFIPDFDGLKVVQVAAG
eukprot:Hpha_TRINITY_DN15332_c2_g2::TRINITY_DN15332_c2_g2_i1::g.92374::m.92374